MSVDYFFDRNKITLNSLKEKMNLNLEASPHKDMWVATRDDNKEWIQIIIHDCKGTLEEDGDKNIHEFTSRGSGGSIIREIALTFQAPFILNGMETSFIDKKGEVICVGDTLEVRLYDIPLEIIKGVVVWDKDSISLKVIESNTSEYDANFSVPPLHDFASFSKVENMVSGVIVEPYDSSNDPYLLGENMEIEMLYNPEYGDNRTCKCGHSYERHFDPFEDWEAVGCKYCQCYRFEENVES